MMTAAADSTVECDGMGNVDALNAWLASNGGATATDSCGAVTWSNNVGAMSDDCGLTGTTDVWFIATDECGNADSVMASFIIVDTTNPSIDDGSDSTRSGHHGMGNMTELNDWTPTTAARRLLMLAAA